MANTNESTNPRIAPIINPAVRLTSPLIDTAGAVEKTNIPKYAPMIARSKLASTIKEKANKNLFIPDSF
ncbi:MAG: hypothetical protein HXY49_10525 [Ignavibacteriaceae bacterium]|nr:hypothetical protein [Ignavibacteriaceae bacterium]